MVTIARMIHARVFRPTLLVAFVAVGSFAALGCSKKVTEPTPSDFKPAEAPPLPPGPDKLQIVDDKVGEGPEAKVGDTVKVHYTGMLLNGKEFDSSRDREPFELTIGQGQVIKGWEEGLPGMRVGGKRTLTVPWDMAYGENGDGDKIPPKAALKFEIELVEIAGMNTQ